MKDTHGLIWRIVRSSRAVAADARKFINLPCWLRPRPLGRKERPATSEALLLYRVRIGGDAHPFPIVGFIPTECFLIAFSGAERKEVAGLLGEGHGNKPPLGMALAYCGDYSMRVIADESGAYYNLSAE